MRYQDEDRNADSKMYKNPARIVLWYKACILLLYNLFFPSFIKCNNSISSAGICGYYAGLTDMADSVVLCLGFQ